MPIPANFKVEANDPSKKGQYASGKLLFGEHRRYAVFAVHTRFENVQWFVNDAETIADDGQPETIRQDDDFDNAVQGLGYGELGI